MKSLNSECVITVRREMAMVAWSHKTLKLDAEKVSRIKMQRQDLWDDSDQHGSTGSVHNPEKMKQMARNLIG